jgi:hypothetical protein
VAGSHSHKYFTIATINYTNRFLALVGAASSREKILEKTGF